LAIASTCYILPPKSFHYRLNLEILPSGFETEGIVLLFIFFISLAIQGGLQQTSLLMKFADRG